MTTEPTQPPVERAEWGIFNSSPTSKLICAYVQRIHAEVCGSSLDPFCCTECMAYGNELAAVLPDHRAQVEGRPLSELRDGGLLWLINRVVFHPRGYALVFHVGDDGAVLGWSLSGDGSEAWTFPDATDQENFQRAEETLRGHRIHEGALTYEQIRAYLEARPAEAAAWFRRASRMDPEWLVQFIRRQDRIHGNTQWRQQP